MKTKEEIIDGEPVYLNDWSVSKRFGLIADFENTDITESEYSSLVCPYRNEGRWLNSKQGMLNALKKYENVTVLFASYSYENYSGYAWVLFTDGVDLYEVNGSHCSCYGLEGQWTPELVVLDELRNRLIKGTWGKEDYSGNQFGSELINFLSFTAEDYRNAK